MDQIWMNTVQLIVRWHLVPTSHNRPGSDDETSAT